MHGKKMLEVNKKKFWTENKNFPNSTTHKISNINCMNEFWPALDAIERNYVQCQNGGWEEDAALSVRRKAHNTRKPIFLAGIINISASKLLKNLKFVRKNH